MSQGQHRVRWVVPTKNESLPLRAQLTHPSAAINRACGNEHSTTGGPRTAQAATHQSDYFVILASSSIPVPASSDQWCILESKPSAQCDLVPMGARVDLGNDTDETIPNAGVRHKNARFRCSTTVYQLDGASRVRRELRSPLLGLQVSLENCGSLASSDLRLSDINPARGV